jgi:hypothetical protein
MILNGSIQASTFFFISSGSLVLLLDIFLKQNQ